MSAERTWIETDRTGWPGRQSGADALIPQRYEPEAWGPGGKLLKHIHDTLNLGVYSKNAHQKTSGFGDATWTYTPMGGSPVLTALTEVKLSQSADSACDLDKFLKDVDVGVRTQRINGALYLSLASRIGGKGRSGRGDTARGPVIWASRSAEDDLSAAALVDMAFTTFATLWPLPAPERPTEESLYSSRWWYSSTRSWMKLQSWNRAFHFWRRRATRCAVRRVCCASPGIPFPPR